MNSPDFWKRCSSCKKPILYEGRFFRCSVSTCNAKRTGYVFCSMPCWSAHVPTMAHRNPWAEDERAPKRAEAGEQEMRASSAPAPTTERGTPATATGRTERRRIVPAVAGHAEHSNIHLDSGQHVPEDILVVVSKLKAYIRARSDCNTSASVNEALSDIIRGHCDRAMKRAIADGRTTVMDRDFSA